MAVSVLAASGWNAMVEKADGFPSHWRISVPLWPALLAAVVPDVIDKVVCDIWGLAPYGRNVTHNLTAVLVMSVAVGAFFRSRAVGISWALGHLGHLLGDITFIPWLWPWVDYAWPNDPRNIAMGVIHTVADWSAGRELRPEAREVWLVGRLGLETIFAMVVAGFWLAGDRFVAARRSLLVVALALWLCIFVFLDWPFFVWSYYHCGIR